MGEGFERALRRRGWVRLEELTLTDINEVCARYGVLLNWKIVPSWDGPWVFDRNRRTWRRSYLTRAGERRWIDGPASD